VDASFSCWVNLTDCVSGLVGLIARFVFAGRIQLDEIKCKQYGIVAFLFALISGLLYDRAICTTHATI
jgi:hypothetical protein